MSGQQIKVTSADGGEFGAYLALPDGAPPPAPGILMLHEIFGVTDWIRETADLFAEQGFCVAAPEMFWRLEPDFVADHRDPVGTGKGRRYKQLIDHDKAVDDMEAVIGRLKSLPECNGRIGVTGFCTGGTLAYLAAARLDVDAAAAYYGTQIHEFLDEGENITCPAIFHMGDKDDRVPAGLAHMAREAWASMANLTIHSYDSGHAFAHTGRQDYYAEAASRKAHARTFELFRTLQI